MEQTDKDVRLELSALYRILHIYGMTDLANQCAGARSAEDKNCSFVHPYGMFYEEITASSLVKIDQNGKKLDSDGPWLNDGCINLAQWIFNKRYDVNFYVHGHATDVMAVGGTKEGLMYLSQAAVYLNHLVGYIDYEFVEDKDFRIKFKNLISKHDILITRNHGYYTVGKTAAEAFFRAYYLEQACTVQVKNLAMGLNKHEIDKQKAAYFWENMSDSDDYNYDGKTEWAALLRKLEREHSNYKN